MAKKAIPRKGPSIESELASVVLAAVGLFGYVALFTHGAGALGTWVGGLMRVLFGSAAPILPAYLVWAAYLVLNRRVVHKARRLVGGLLVLAVVAAFFHVSVPLSEALFYGRQGIGGGFVGAGVMVAAVRLVGTAGRWVVMVAAILVGLLLAVDRPLIAPAVDFIRKRRRVARPSPANAYDDIPATETMGGGPAPVVYRGGEPYPETGPSGPEEGESPPASQVDAPQPPPPEPAEAPPVGVLPPGVGLLTEKASSSIPAAKEHVFDNYQLPPLQLLRRPPRRTQGQVLDVQGRARLLEETLQSFGVQARVVEIHQGPTVTRFDLQPAKGVKVARIKALADDLALALAARTIRIEAPIPGRAAVGVEVPNQEVLTVYLREVLESPEFQQSSSLLTVGLGQDIAGRPVVADLGQTIHLLIAGATGSGKSVCLNALICSLLFRARPDQVRFLMIDPKRVELSVFNGIPHLITPLITDPKHAAAALRWVVKEMMRRYELLATAGVRDVNKYNELVSTSHDGEYLPYIVVVIDELADLMMVAASDVEDTIWRLAQMARAAGIHLVVATQRPSVDVITGVIKANIPSRIAFAVSSQADSRTILDGQGAEELLGRGDMLFHPVGASHAIRAQGAYVSDYEVERVVEFVRNQASPQFQEIAASDDEAATQAELDDPLLPDAVRVILETRQASASMLQRRLRVGYTRAARLIDIMESRGIVGPHEGAKPREILIGLEQYRRMFGQDINAEGKGGGR